MLCADDKIQQLLDNLELQKDESIERTFKGVAKNFRCARPCVTFMHAWREARSVAGRLSKHLKALGAFLSFATCKTMCCTYAQPGAH